MSRVAINAALLVVLAASVGVNLAIRSDLTRPNREVMPGMVRTAAYDSFAPNPSFADGKTLRQPVAGTVMRPVRTAPAPVSLQRGRVVFTTFCQPCHGAAGKGDGPVALRGYPPPASLVAARAVNLTDAQMFAILTSGQRNMPPYASQISPEDRWSAIALVRSMQGAAK